jgi:putative DNA methylase
LSLAQVQITDPLADRTERIPPFGTSALEVEFPSTLISRIAESESWRKEVHRPATSTHKWWAKRLGSVFRGILASAVTESEADAIEAYTTGFDLGNVVVLDPFGGSGTTLVEASKLGAHPIALDINPVATLVERQAVQPWDTTELDRAFAEVERSSRAEIDRLHSTENGEPVLYYFWVATVGCPDCGQETRLFSTHVFAQHAYPRKHPEAHAVCPECLDVVATRYDFETETCSNGHRFDRRGVVAGGKMVCPGGHESSVVAAVQKNSLRHELYAKLILGSDGKRYSAIDEFDHELFAESEQLLHREKANLVLPTGRLERGENTTQALRWGFDEWRQFFNSRQLYSLGLLGASVRDLKCGAPEREALAALFSGTLEFNNLFCSFKGEGTGAVRHMFSHHVLKPERMPLEAHPWGTPSSSGSFSTLFDRRLKRAHAYKNEPIDQIVRGDKVSRAKGISLPLSREIAGSWPEFAADGGSAYVATMNASSTDIPDSAVDLVVTDPPYMDNVHYSELADFFHAWLREIRPFETYPAGDRTTRRKGEVQNPSPDGFQEAIRDVWTECARVLKDDGILAFTFHQARISGWAALVTALAESGFVITAIQPVKGEMSTSSTKYGKEPSNLDSIVVCRKTGGDLSEKASAAEEAKIAMHKLAALADAGITVGPGDVRSVVRGHVLAAYTWTRHELSLNELLKEAELLSSDAVSQWGSDRSALESPGGEMEESPRATLSENRSD